MTAAECHWVGLQVGGKGSGMAILGTTPDARGKKLGWRTWLADASAPPSSRYRAAHASLTRRFQARIACRRALEPRRFGLVNLQTQGQVQSQRHSIHLKRCAANRKPPGRTQPEPPTRCATMPAWCSTSSGSACCWWRLRRRWCVCCRAMRRCFRP